MSREFVESFFPAVFHHVQYHHAPIAEFLFPESVAMACPEVVVGRIRNPVLAVWAVIGIWIGYQGAMTRFPTKKSLWWQVAFASFGLMNVVALPLHCFVPAQHSSPDSYPILWALDCLLTGLSCMAILGALLLRKSAFGQALWLLTCLVLAWLAVQQFLLHGTTLYIELFYMLPVVVVSYVLGYNLIRQAVVGYRPVLALALMWGGAWIASLGIVGDAWLCQNITTARSYLPLYDGLTAPTLTFCGCDIIFVGLNLWLLQKKKETTVISNGKKKAD